MNAVSDSARSVESSAEIAARPTRRVALLEDDSLVQVSFAKVLDSHGYEVECFETADAFLEHRSATQPFGCVVVDLQLRGSSGWEVISGFRTRSPHSSLVVASAHLDVRSVVRAMQAGALAVLEKPVSLDELLVAVRAGCESAERLQAVDALRTDARDRLARLSARETEVLDRVVAGLASKNIASELGISIRTVEAFRSRVLAKIDVRSTAELVRLHLLARKDDLDPMIPN